MADWECPWGLCDHDQAQHCRNDATGDSCRRRFPEGMTPEQARTEVTKPFYAPNRPGPRAGAAPVVPLTEQRVREIVRDELARNAAAPAVSPAADPQRKEGGK